MRIVGGTLRGRTLSDFNKLGIRPTSDMARESFFNIVRDKIVGANFLDLFSGTGAMGIEAYSRGAKKVVCNDCSKESIRLILKNLEKLNIKDYITVSNADYIACVERQTEKFDIIYIDPPYNLGVNLSAVSWALRIVKKDGIVVLESEKPFTDEIDGATVVDIRRYGRAHLTFFRPKENCVFAGTFDPITNGHKQIIDACLKEYNKVFVVIGENPNKKTTFPLDVRKEFIKNVYKTQPRVEVICYSDKKANYKKFLLDNEITSYVRGIRDEKDLEFEKKYEEKNGELYPFVKTVYKKADEKYKTVSSSGIKEKIKNGEDTDGLVPAEIKNELIKLITDGRE